MSVGPSDESIDFKVDPRSRNVQSGGYERILLVLLGIAVAILIVVAVLQHAEIKKLQNQLETLRNQVETLCTQNKDLQASDPCKMIPPESHHKQ